VAVIFDGGREIPSSAMSRDAQEVGAGLGGSKPPRSTSERRVRPRVIALAYNLSIHFTPSQDCSKKMAVFAATAREWLVGGFSGFQYNEEKCPNRRSKLFECHGSSYLASLTECWERIAEPRTWCRRHFCAGKKAIANAVRAPEGWLSTVSPAVHQPP